MLLTLSLKTDTIALALTIYSVGGITDTPVDAWRMTYMAFHVHNQITSGCQKSYSLLNYNLFVDCELERQYDKNSRVLSECAMMNNSRQTRNPVNYWLHDMFAKSTWVKYSKVCFKNARTLKMNALLSVEDQYL